MFTAGAMLVSSYSYTCSKSERQADDDEVLFHRFRHIVKIAPRNATIRQRTSTNRPHSNRIDGDAPAGPGRKVASNTPMRTRASALTTPAYTQCSPFID